MAHKGEPTEMNKSEIREAMAREWFDHLCETDFREIHSKYALEDELMLLRDRIASVGSVNMHITKTILMRRAHVCVQLSYITSHVLNLIFMRLLQILEMNKLLVGFELNHHQNHAECSRVYKKNKVAKED